MNLFLINVSNKTVLPKPQNMFIKIMLKLKFNNHEDFKIIINFIIKRFNLIIIIKFNINHPIKTNLKNQIHLTKKFRFDVIIK